MAAISKDNGLSRWFSGYAPGGIRWKIAAPYVLLTLLVAFAGSFMATRLVSNSLQDRFVNQLAESARVTTDALVRRERQHLQVSRSIAFTTGVAQSLRAGDEAALRRAIEPIAANSRTEFIEVLDLNGRRVVGLRLADEQSLAYAPVPDTTERAGWALVQNVLRKQSDGLGSKYAQLVRLDDGRPALYTAGPIYDGANLTGVVLVGSSLESLLPAIRREALADVTFYANDGSILGTTFAAEGDDAQLGLPGSPGAIAGWRQSRDLFGRGFEFLYGELRIREETVGTFSIALPSSFISSASNQTRWTMVAVFVTATIAVLGVGALVSKAVTAPLIKLARTALTVANGDLTVRSGYRGRDEVGILATSFDVMTSRLATTHLQTIRTLTSAIDARDPYTAGHSVRVGQLSVEIGRELELPKRDLQYLEIGGYLHDVGKIGIRDNILLKAAPLNARERKLVEEHPRIGLSIIQHVELPDAVIQAVGSHHEKLDGTGYPRQLAGNDISIFARVVAVSDVWDALTTHRPYRPAMDFEEAAEIMLKEARLYRLDERAVEALLEVLPRWSRRLELEKELQGLLLPELEELARSAG